jgi:hypothetical protein
MCLNTGAICHFEIEPDCSGWEVNEQPYFFLSSFRQLINALQSCAVIFFRSYWRDKNH